MRLKTKHEIILETVNYYKNNLRSILQSNNICCYQHPVTGARCAVGRVLKEDWLAKIASNTLTLEKEENHNDNIISFSYFLERYNIEPFKEEYQINDMEFWIKLQIIHDTHEYWNGNILTEKGEEYVIQKLQEYPD